MKHERKEDKDIHFNKKASKYSLTFKKCRGKSRISCEEYSRRSTRIKPKARSEDFRDQVESQYKELSAAGFSVDI